MTKSRRVAGEKGFKCKTCKAWHAFSAYVYGHWRDALTHTCECGAKHTVQMGKAVQFKEGIVEDDS